MKAQRAFGLALSWPRVTAVLLAVVALLAVSSRGVPWVADAGLAAAVVLGVLALVTYRRMSLLSALVGRITDRRVDVVAALGTGARFPVDHHRVYGREVVGIREHGGQLVAVVAVDGPAHSPSVLVRHSVDSSTTLPVGLVAAAIRQFDVLLDGIDIVSVGARRARASIHPYAQSYTSMVGDHAAVGQRRTWLVLRMDPLRNVTAVAARDSVASTLAAAAERLAHDLTGRRYPARPLTAAQIAETDIDLLAGFSPTRAKPRWREIVHTDGYVSAFWVSPRDISTETLTRLWLPDTDAAAVTIRLTPRRDGGAAGEVQVAAWVRYHSGKPLISDPLIGLNRLGGRHLAALRASLPLPGLAGLAVPARALAVDETLAAPIGPTGIIVGSIGSGLPMLLPLAAPTGHTNVTVAAELAVLMKLALRAAATGNQVLVCSARDDRWMLARAPGLKIVPSVPPAVEPGPRPVVLVCDLVPAPGPIPGVAVTISAVEHGTTSLADLHFHQDSPTTMMIRTAEFQTRVYIDTTTERSWIRAPQPLPGNGEAAGAPGNGRPWAGGDRHGEAGLPGHAGVGGDERRG
jgi:type VII secretion protein EccE